MILDCGCPGEYPDWQGQDVDLALQPAHVLPIASFLFMPLAYEVYRQRQQEEIDALGLEERWPGFALTRTGLLRGRVIRLLTHGESPSRHVQPLPGQFTLQATLHEGGIGSVRTSVREQQMGLLDRGRLPKEMYMAYLTCPRCAEARGGERILLLRRWQPSPRLASRTG